MDTSLDNKHLHTALCCVCRRYGLEKKGKQKNVFNFNLEMWKMKFSINLRYFKDFFFLSIRIRKPSISLFMLHTRILFSCDKGERTKIGKKCVNKEHGRWSSDVYEMAVLMNLLCQKQLSLSLPSSSALFLKKKKINGEKLKLFISMYGIYLRIWKGPLGLVCQSSLSHTFFLVHQV